MERYLHSKSAIQILAFLIPFVLLAGPVITVSMDFSKANSDCSFILLKLIILIMITGTEMIPRILQGKQYLPEA